MRGSGRIRSAIASPTTHIAAAANQGMTSVSSSRSLPANSGRKTSGPSAAPKSAPKRTYEIARAFFSSGYMSAAAVRASRTAPFIAPTPTNPRITSGALSTTQPSAVSRHADHPDDEAACDHRDPTEPVHQPSRGQRGERAGGQEDRRPEAEDRLDAGDEDERDRRDGDGELQHAREQDQAERRGARCYAGPGTRSPRSGNSTSRALRSSRARRRRRARYDPGSVWGARANRAERAAGRAADPKT